MPTVANAARVTCKDGAVWRVCASCGLLAAYAPEVYHCDDCQAAPVREGAVAALLALVTWHAGGPARMAVAFGRLADAYERQAAGRSGASARELAALAADLREAVRRLGERGRF